MDIKQELLKVAKPYGVRDINFGGCKVAQAKGFQGAMRRKAHAHCHTDDPNRGLICFLSHTPERRAFNQKTGKPTKLFWHEVGHIYRRSWSQRQCDLFGYRQVRQIR